MKYIFVATNASFSDVKADLEPLLKDIESFEVLAKQKKYINNIKAGRFLISKGMTNNDIINSIRSRNLPIKIAFNNQHSLAELANRISSQIEANNSDLLRVFSDVSMATFTTLVQPLSQLCQSNFWNYF